jgi:hypothetical protein
LKNNPEITDNIINSVLRGMVESGTLLKIKSKNQKEKDKFIFADNIQFMDKKYKDKL